VIVASLLATAHAGAADRRIEVVARGGGAYFAPFPFVTVGGEVRLRLVAGLRLAASLETWGTKRVPPPEFQLEEDVYSEWNWIQPASLGAVYAVSVGPVTPYGGLELLVANHYEDSWSIGGRARAGLDYFVIPHFGLNANLGVGAWNGDNWAKVEDGAENSGPVVQGTLGVVVGF
jgi:hypothetical protein